jgi:hypothetical protein
MPTTSSKFIKYLSLCRDDHRLPVKQSVTNHNLLPRHHDEGSLLPLWGEAAVDLAREDSDAGTRTGGPSFTDQRWR